MTDIVQLDHGQVSGRSVYDGNMAQHIDARLLLLPTLSLLSFITAVLIAANVLLRPIFPQLNLEDPLFLEAINWPPGLTTFRFLAIFFLLLAIVLYLVARWQFVHSTSIQASAGCPSCQEHQLLRIRRTKRDRIFTLSGVRVARYQCRECHWNGRRVFIKSYHPLEEAPAQLFTGFEIVQKPDLSEFTTADIAEANMEEIPAETAVLVAPPATGLATETAEADAANVAIEESPTTIMENKNRAAPSASAPEDIHSVEPKQTNHNREASQEQLLKMGDEARIMTTFGVNLRAKPRSDANWVGLLGPKTVVVINRGKQQDDGTVWYYVTSNGQSGWVTDVCLKQPLDDNQ